MENMVFWRCIRIRSVGFIRAGRNTLAISVDRQRLFGSCVGESRSVKRGKPVFGGIACMQVMAADAGREEICGQGCGATTPHHLAHGDPP